MQIKLIKFYQVSLLSEHFLSNIYSNLQECHTVVLAFNVLQLRQDVNCETVGLTSLKISSIHVVSAR